MILLDTSALAKLLVNEAESSYLRTYVQGALTQGQHLCISSLAATELHRMSVRVGGDPAQVSAVLRPFRLLRLTEAILQLAARLPYPSLPTLDAIHIATAITAEARAMVTYDDRQAHAVLAEALTLIRPTAQ